MISIKKMFYRLICFYLLLLSIPSCAWELFDKNAFFFSTSSKTKTLTMEEVSEMRVRDIKRALTRRHGYSTDEVGRVLDKKELIQTLSFEEHKINQKELETERRDLFWKGLWVTIVVGVITLCWPMIRHLLEVAHVNLVVYTDRKYLEMSRCWDYRSIEGCL